MPKKRLTFFLSIPQRVLIVFVTLDSAPGIDVVPGINIAPGTFGKTIQRSP